MLKNKLLITITVILVLMVLPVSVFGATDREETANDFFELYNRKKIAGFSDVQNEYETAKKKYETLYRDAVNTEAFNKMYESAEDYQAKLKEQIDNDISNLMIKNNLIAKSIEETIDGDFDYLLELDAEYKTNLEEINNLLKNREKYSLTEKQIVSYDKIDELGKEVSRLKTEYDGSVSVSTLGDVTNVKYPLSKATIITSRYGDRIDPINKTSIRFHAGIDLRASIGTGVLSIFNGVVSATGYGALGGYYVKVDHGNGISSYYCHLSKIKCSVGQRVSQYDEIALSGNTGSRTTGPHLHFGLYIDGNSIDPGILFNGG